MSTRHRESAPQQVGRRWWHRLTSTRTRALLSLVAVVALVPGLGAQGTFAFWTDNATVQGGTLTAGTLDLKVNGKDAYATTTLGMTAMVPGATSAEVLSIKNQGTVPLTYSLAGGLTGTDAAIFNTTGALRLTITQGAKVGTGNSSTCGGDVVLTTALTSATTTVIQPRRPTMPLAPAATETACFQLTFDDAIASANPGQLQGKTATVTLTASATSDLT